MILEREAQFRPVHITLTTIQEVSTLWAALRAASEEPSAFGYLPDRYRGLWYTQVTNISQIRLTNMLNDITNLLRGGE